MYMNLQILTFAVFHENQNFKNLCFNLINGIIKKCDCILVITDKFLVKQTEMLTITFIGVM